MDQRNTRMVNPDLLDCLGTHAFAIQLAVGNLSELTGQDPDVVGMHLFGQALKKMDTASPSDIAQVCTLNLSSINKAAEAIGRDTLLGCIRVVSPASDSGSPKWVKLSSKFINLSQVAEVNVFETNERPAVEVITLAGEAITYRGLEADAILSACEGLSA